MIAKAPRTYDSYQPLWPPRPEVKEPPYRAVWYEGRGYWAQKKRNGTCTTIHCKGGTRPEVIFKTRHLDLNDGDHLAWVPLPEHLEFFQSFGPKWNVFHAELMHGKAKGTRHELFIHDWLVADGAHLTGKTFAERQDMLHQRFGVDFTDDELTGNLSADCQRVHEYVVIARNFRSNFVEIIQRHLRPNEDEGLVFKRPDAKLAPCVKPLSNSTWQAKCRITKANLYSF